MTTFSDPFTYDLPLDRIAQRPVYPYDQARLLIVDRAANKISETLFTDLPSFLQSTDHLIFNDSKVIPARLFGKMSEEDREIELLLLRAVADDQWLCIGKPMRLLREGVGLTFAPDFSATVLPTTVPHVVLLQFHFSPDTTLRACLDRYGIMPIPPYIRGGHGDSQDIVDYQPVMAVNEGSIASPTASLHFTPSLIEKIAERGCQISRITLHVGSASFKMVWTEQSGVMTPPEGEELWVNPEVIRSVKRSRELGGRSVAIGTTAVRALESAWSENISNNQTNLFIHPPYKFQGVDLLVTNFHQPGTTHLLILEALLGRDLLKRSYEYALERGFRFLSYGDGMLVI